MKRLLLVLLCSGTGYAFGQGERADVAFAEADFAKAKGLYAKAVASASADDMTAHYRIRIAVCEARLGHFSVAKEKLESLLNTDSPKPSLAAELHEAMGELYLKMALYDQALEELHKASDLIDSKHKELKAENLTDIGLVHWHIGNDELAESYLLQALDMRISMGDREGMAKSYNNPGSGTHSK